MTFSSHTTQGVRSKNVFDPDLMAENLTAEQFFELLFELERDLTDKVADLRVRCDAFAQNKQNKKIFYFSPFFFTAFLTKKIKKMT